jgi:hypothetical protein
MVHRRWYDSTKAQLALFAVFLSMMAGAVGIGYSSRDAVVVLRGVPTELDRQRETNAAIWSAINRQADHLSELRRQNQAVMSAIVELCYIQATSAAQRTRCRSIIPSTGGD